MTIPNFPSGYPGFHQAIESITESIGGSQCRRAITEIFVKHLYSAIHHRNGSGYIPSGNQWTEAVDLDFDRAVETATWFLSKPRETPSHEVEWQNGYLRIRGNECLLERNEYALPVARVNPGYGDIRVALTDVGEYISLDHGTFRNGVPKATYARSMQSAEKSLKRLVKTFFGADMLTSNNATYPHGQEFRGR